MYRYLNDDAKILVPLVCGLFFLYFFYKNKKDSKVPSVGANANIPIFIGCILMSIVEFLKQNNIEYEQYLTPFIGLDFCYFFLGLGATMLLIAASRHEKYKKNIKFRNLTTAYLVLFYLAYILARIIYW